LNLSQVHQQLRVYLERLEDLEHLSLQALDPGDVEVSSIGLPYLKKLELEEDALPFFVDVPNLESISLKGQGKGPQDMIQKVPGFSSLLSARIHGYWD